MLRICDRCRTETDPEDLVSVRFQGQGWLAEHEVCPTCAPIALAKCIPESVAK